MYRPTPPRSGPDKDLIIGIIAVVFFVVIAGGAGAWFLLKDTFSSGTPPTTPVVTFSTELQQAYTTFYEKGKLEDGISMYRGLTGRFPNEATAWREYAVATTYLGTEPYSNTIALLQKASQLDPQDALTYYYLTNAYAFGQRNDEAAQASIAAAKIGQGSWGASAAAARYTLAKFDYTKSQAEIDTVQKNAGSSANDPFYNIILGSLLLGNNVCTQALKVLEIPLTKWPGLALPKILKAECLLIDSDSKNFKANRAAAFDLILEGQKLQPGASFVSGILTFYYAYYAQDTTSAEKYAQQYKKIEPDDIFNIVTMAQIDHSNNDNDQSSKDYEACLKVNPDNWICSEGLALILFYQGLDLKSKGKDQEATVAYQAALDKALSIEKRIDNLPENGFGLIKGDFFYLLGNISNYMSDNSAAISYYEKATSHPVQAYVYAYLGYAYLADDRNEEAQAAYEAGKALDPDDSYIKELGEELEKPK